VHFDPWRATCDGYGVPWPVSPWPVYPSPYHHPYTYYQPPISSPSSEQSSASTQAKTPSTSQNELQIHLPPRGHSLPVEAIFNPSKDCPKVTKDSDITIYAKPAIMEASSSYKNAEQTPEKVYWPPGRSKRNTETGMHYNNVLLFLPR